MKTRLAVVTALVGALVASVSGAQAAQPVLDGKKIKKLEKSGVGAATMQHLAAFDELTCDDPAKCLVLPFTYQPAKGVKGDLMFTATWTNPAADFDLYVIEKDPKKKTEAVVGQCASGPMASEKVFIPARELRSGRHYRIVVGYFLPLGDTVKAKVEIGVPSTIPTTVPAQVDDLHATNCVL